MDLSNTNTFSLMSELKTRGALKRIWKKSVVPNKYQTHYLNDTMRNKIKNQIINEACGPEDNDAAPGRIFRNGKMYVFKPQFENLPVHRFPAGVVVTTTSILNELYCRKSLLQLDVSVSMNVSENKSNYVKKTPGRLLNLKFQQMMLENIHIHSLMKFSDMEPAHPGWMISGWIYVSPPPEAIQNLPQIQNYFGSDHNFFNY